jgi:VCBS repeat-containing protein
VQVAGSVAWADAEGDAIASVNIGGTLLPPSGSITVAGTYGNLVMNADGSYIYTLNPGVDEQGVTDMERFAITVTDEYGAAGSEALEIALTPLSHAPQSENVMLNWPYIGSTPLTTVTGKLIFSDVDMNINPLETLTLAVNGVVIPAEGLVVNGEHGNLTIQTDGSFSYVPHNGKLNTPNLEEFSYTVTDAAGNTSESSLYIRLSDSAPFPPDTRGMTNLADLLYAWNMLDFDGGFLDGLLGANTTPQDAGGDSLPLADFGNDDPGSESMVMIGIITSSQGFIEMQFLDEVFSQ